MSLDDDELEFAREYRDAWLKGHDSWKEAKAALSQAEEDLRRFVPTFESDPVDFVQFNASRRADLQSFVRLAERELASTTEHLLRRFNDSTGLRDRKSDQRDDD